ncbi:hypothetical protein SCATT_45540 [Streptantibioticus cattleyicolor NRRL 8057 = DSM 46488]|uniref:Uncharacterized protein n=1 Tax=Streptantibioticus cattleyicolor (strain ATCC 35852 / DSM 46488 / JCM 4925 / NBRC 14057 / NRRL 8057) TaxID=1003195 RepID=G8X0L0_STREN|nr:hypothetical protein SCATT_45540 [Streptantibioticus cattleyicolor NRRL 8057 = DSM 46488]
MAHGYQRTEGHRARLGRTPPDRRPPRAGKRNREGARGHGVAATSGRVR